MNDPTTAAELADRLLATDAPLWVLGWGAAFFVCFTVLLAVLAALVERSGPIRLHHWAEEAGGRLRTLYDLPARFRAFRFLLSLLAKLMPLVLLWLLASLATRAGTQVRWLVPLAVVLPLVLAEWLAHRLVGKSSEEALRRMTGVLRAAYWLSMPVVWLLSYREKDGEEEAQDEDLEDQVSEDEIDAFLDVGRREGILEPEEEELVRSIVDFGDTRVRSVMVPRVEIVCAPLTASLEEVAERFFASKHARIPLYRDSIDQVVGILHIRDLFEAMHTGKATEVAPLSNPPHFVPESKPLRDLLNELQARHQQMAIVLDEYGGVAGLVTVEDLVEEIVGEINDEHEESLHPMESLEGGGWRLEGRTDLEQLRGLLGVDFDEKPYETVSGLICGELGYVPKPEEVVTTHGLVFKIEEADERRVTMVSVHPVADEEAASEAAATPEEN